jgi:DNA-binding NtrC family response regulator
MLDILVVVTDGVDRRRIVQVLDAAGYSVSSASTFEEARRVLTHTSPDLVMTDERLGEYNGLHVLVSARSENPQVGAIVMTPILDRGLETDASRLNVECVVKPQDPAKWLAIVSRVLDAHSGSGWWATLTSESAAQSLR